MNAAPRGPLQIRWTDRLTPTAVLLVSRAWVLREVGANDENNIVAPPDRGATMRFGLWPLPPGQTSVRPGASRPATGPSLSPNAAADYFLTAT